MQPPTIPLAFPPPGLGEGPGAYAARILRSISEFERYAGWEQRYNEFVRNTGSPDSMMGAIAFQHELVLFALTSLEFEYYGLRRTVDGHPFGRCVVFDSSISNGRLASYLGSIDRRLTYRSDDVFDLTVAILLVEGARHHAEIFDGQEFEHIYHHLDRRTLAFLGTYLDPRFFDTFEQLMALGGIPPVPLVVTTAPKTELTVGIGDRLYAGGGFATVGAFAAREEVVQGFVTVAHAFDLGQEAQIGGNTYKVADGYLNRYWDAAFIPLLLTDMMTFPRDFFADISAPPLPPRPLQGGSFYGGATSMGRTVVDSMDYNIGRFWSLARCVLTKRCTSPGDSGAVLWGDDGTAIGMAVARTADNQPDLVSHSLWVWFPGILNALGATIIGPVEAAKLPRKPPPPGELLG